MLAQQIAKYMLSALGGDGASFAALNGVRNEFDDSLRGMEEGAPGKGLPPLPREMAGTLAEMINAWAELRARADDVLSKQHAILSLGKFIGVIDGAVPQLQDKTTQIVAGLISSGAPSKQVAEASRLLMLGQRVQNNIRSVMSGGERATLAIDQFGRDAREYAQVMQGLLQGDSSLGIEKVADAGALKLLREASSLFGGIKAQAEEIVVLTPSIIPALESVGVVGQVSDQVSGVAERMIGELGKSPGRFSLLGIKVGPAFVTVFAGLAAALLLALGLVLLGDARRREQESKQQNDRNQQAILRLLDEMGDLADGDLTVEATVTEDITGAIADSVNYAIEALRGLVMTINETTEKVTASARESRATAIQLAEASNQQAMEITEASNSISTMAESVDDMSKEASQSAEIAQRSVEIAATGAESVRNTISGMDGIREQIQETAKRIKRLGESSQEIGDIVELIDDIADQTNILALNAAMQAAMAGEAGRGFAVVADEVQRLAERAGNATKQIEALVKTIQADTNEAMSSMETSTSGVVRVASLTEGAGEALKEIENVSNYIAESTRQIAQSAQFQSSQASRINEIMRAIQEVSVKSSEGTGQTAHAIGTLADMADELQRSVAGFRLP
ncbi:MAG: type IV pili methyl-accepting chemotaxis transducer N-terminal domain-containing protein [Gammaproteobacteria bacterium]|nr:type IV pili methyl-accepting chemotaxis transducer N-terminal domain-containing protein [Gammaproteobacteria bacterium]MBU1654869.1 type IV pili methyl-accepting chemotaxis transducer N-terminal domain-containing protein [Gammaproteobacteria bacterium]MBU1961160.1 type IV pili methyl-accepting chemotaxis transducer N-terminal domain-containing protein [Gammaproteobacteria bacterium]